MGECHFPGGRRASEEKASPSRASLVKRPQFEEEGYDNVPDGNHDQHGDYDNDSHTHNPTTK